VHAPLPIYLFSKPLTLGKEDAVLYLRRLVSVSYIIIIDVVVVKKVPVVLQLFVADNFGHVCTLPTKRLDKISGQNI
jgi:hypothetical protein